MCSLIGISELKGFKGSHIELCLNEKLFKKFRAVCSSAWGTLALTWRMFSLVSKASSLLRKVSYLDLNPLEKCLVWFEKRSIWHEGAAKASMGGSLVDLGATSQKNWYFLLPKRSAAWLSHSASSLSRWVRDLINPSLSYWATKRWIESEHVEHGRKLNCEADIRSRPINRG